jgi:molecular chaperone DnaK
MAHEHVLGIDFGTTNTVAAWLDEHGEPHLVPVQGTRFTLPSVVAYHAPGEPPLVGDAAKELLADEPRHTIHASKRFLGRRFLSDYVGRHRSRFRWELIEGPDGTVAADVFGHVVPLADMAQAILARILELANIAAGTPFKTCVLAVPAHFTHRQRDLLRRVAEKLDLEVRAIVNEPTAAAVHYARGRTGRRNLLVYDLGGGTFDTTLMRVDGELVRVLATGGEAFLGGIDFDSRIADMCAERFEKDRGVAISDDRTVMQRLIFAAEDTKILLSFSERAFIECPCVILDGDEPVDLVYELTRAEVERACAPLIERTLGIALQTVGQASLSTDDVDELILVGGQTRMPGVRRRLGVHFPVHADAVDPDASVALGAATLGAQDSTLTDVLPMPILLMLPGAGPREAIEKDAALPCIRDVPLQRPPAGRDLPIIVYEAMDLTSIERDILGTLRVSSQWLTDNPGDLLLSCALTPSSDLRFRVVTAEGGQQPLSFVDDRSENLSAPVGGGLTRGETRVPVDLPVGVRANLSDELVALSTANLSSGGAFIRSVHLPRPGQRLEVFLYVGEVPLGMRGDVTHVVSSEQAAVTGEPGGFGVRFLPTAPEVQGRLDAFVDSLREGRNQGKKDVPAERPAGAVSEDIEQASARIQQFFDDVNEGRTYRALGLQPLAMAADIKKATTDLRALMQSVSGKVPDTYESVLDIAGRVLDRTEAMLLNPRKRLEHDMKHGLVFADERLARAQESGIFNPGLLREAWRKTSPGDVDKAQIHLAYAVKAKEAGDLDAASDAARQALELDPFDLELRRFVFELGQKVNEPGPG